MPVLDPSIATLLASHLIGVGGFDAAPDPEISIPRGATFRRAGVIVHESTDLHLAAPIEVDGIQHRDDPAS